MTFDSFLFFSFLFFSFLSLFLSFPFFSFLFLSFPFFSFLFLSFPFFSSINSPPLRSRLILKNLPKHLTEERLRTHLEKWSDLGQITDIKIQRVLVLSFFFLLSSFFFLLSSFFFLLSSFFFLLSSFFFLLSSFFLLLNSLSSDGRSRRFGFVGFNTAKEARAAKGHFNNSFIDTSKVIIDFARPVSPFRKKVLGDDCNLPDFFFRLEMIKFPVHGVNILLGALVMPF